jgi:hypothetical protein
MLTKQPLIVSSDKAKGKGKMDTSWYMRNVSRGTRIDVKYNLISDHFGAPATTLFQHYEWPNSTVFFLFLENRTKRIGRRN